MKQQHIASTLLAGLLLLLPLSRDAYAQDATRVQVTAQRFSFSPAELTLKRGTPVTLVLISRDVAHGLRFRELGFEIKVDKGKVAEKTFTPEKIGDFVGHCSVFCGSGHGSMMLTLHVVE